MTATRERNDYFGWIKFILYFVGSWLWVILCP